jgi:hypothetical protein
MEFFASQTAENAVYRERLQQAKRVMLGLSEQHRANNFNIDLLAVRSDHGIIAGHCGLDPWFHKLGFFTYPDTSFGDVSMSPSDFFGTSRPFFSNHYATSKSVTFDDAITALDNAIASFADNVSEVAG